MRQFLAMVDMDCDGPVSYIYRMDVPSNLTDDAAMRKAVELDQIRYRIYDPSEWFTIPAELEGMVANIVDGREYASVKGNIFHYHYNS